MQQINKLFGLSLLLFGFMDICCGITISRVYTKDCHYFTGVIVDVSEETVTLHDLDGNFQILTIDDISLLGEYQVYGNPFTKIALNSPYLLEVSSHSTASSFYAYAIGFEDDLLIFLDNLGQVHVVENDEIIALRWVLDLENIKYSSLVHERVNFSHPPQKQAVCHSSKDGDSATKKQSFPPSVVVGDSFRIRSHFLNLRQGYRQLKSLAERTIFYPVPLLFDDKTRLGFGQTKYFEGSEFSPFSSFTMPLYLSFGGGTPYRFQSYTTLGGSQSSYLPSMLEANLLETQFKSHLLHGIFLANLNGISAGRQVYTMSFVPRAEDKYARKRWMEQSFNHLTALGVDWGSWGVSWGYFFPVFAIGQGQSELRQLTSHSPSQILKLSYRNSDWLFESILYRTYLKSHLPQQNENNDWQAKSSAGLYWYSDKIDPISYRISSHAIRLNSQYLGWKDKLVWCDILIKQTNYDESFKYLSSSNAFGHHAQGQREYGLRVGIRYDFGKWMALKADGLILSIEQQKGLASEGKDSHRSLLTSVTTAFEIIL